ncbi:MAG: DUF4932 domain-containing protein, partial [Flavobacterium sp.]
MIKITHIQYTLTFLLLISTSVSFAQKVFSVKTDHRVEALSIFYTLSTADTLEVKPTPSTYYRDVKKYFKPYNLHPSLNWYRNLKNWDGPDMASIGLFLSQKYPFKLIIQPEVNYVRNSSVDSFLYHFNAFYKECYVAKFIKKHEADYRKMNIKAEFAIGESGILNDIKAFYNSTSTGEFMMYTDALCNHGSNAIPSGNKIFNGNIMVKAGYIEDKSRKLTDDSPVNFEPAVNVVAHESSHIYLKNFVKKYHARLYRIKNIFLITTKGKKLADEQWENEVDELLVRACVAKILAIKYGK